MKEGFTVAMESKESKAVLFEDMQKARDICMMIYGKMMTGNISVHKAQELLDTTFIESGLFTQINNSDVSTEFKTRLRQVLEDPYLIFKLAHTYGTADTSLENLFVGALGLIEGESSDLEIKDASDREKISSILKSVKEITHHEVLDMKYKHYFIGHCPGSAGTMISKIDGKWKQVTVSDGNLEVVPDSEETGITASDVEQIRSYDEKLSGDIKRLILDIKFFLADRSSVLPEKMVEILTDLMEELSQMTSQSLDETQPSIVDYVGSSFEGRFEYTGIVAKEFKYRNFLRGKL